MMNRRVSLLIFLTAIAGGGTLQGAELSVGNLSILAGDTADVIVSGDITSESTFGVTIMLEIVSRGGNVGTVEFTPSPPLDIYQMGDPWPGFGTFSPYDTDPAGTNSPILNGSVDDSGAGPNTTNFSGTLTGFPVIASFDAEGIWDVLLTTSVGDSSWEGLATTLLVGTITVALPECLVDLDCDDGAFCNGGETCVGGFCIAGSDPCPGQFCDETADLCVDCLFDGDCDDFTFCNGAEGCVSGACASGSDPCPGQLCDESSDLCVDCLIDGDCGDGLFCNGTETCVAGFCSAGVDPCSGQTCDEINDACVTCSTNAECDDGNTCTDDVCNIDTCEYTPNSNPCDDALFCTATDVCSGGVCVGSGDPCGGQACDELSDQCLFQTATLTAGNLTLGYGGAGDLVVSGEIADFDTFGVNILVELVPRLGFTGTLSFTASPPEDIVQLGDPWPGIGTFTAYDTDSTGSDLLNGSVDASGSVNPAPVTFSGSLASFPVTASLDAGGIWDVVLSTSAGDSTWEGVVTTLSAGTITVSPSVGLSVNNFAMPPDAIADVVVSGNVENQLTYGVTIQVELMPQAGAVGTLTFTIAPPSDIISLGDPWPTAGAFSPFDTDTTGSELLNGSIEDNGTYLLENTYYSGLLASYPVISSLGADGIWDVTLTTSMGSSVWENLATVRIDGTVTVTAGACLIDVDCDDANSCTADVCTAGVCGYTVIAGACDDGDLCTENDTCVADVCGGSPIDCSSLDDTCNLGTCNAGTGICEPAPVNEAGSCDDLDPCTELDDCLLGQCSGDQILGCINCTLATDCDDGNSCTTDTCQGGVCANTDNSNPCDDGDACTTSDTCTIGACVGGPPPDCDDGNGCTDDSCDSIAGCQSVDNTNLCDDGNPCTNGDICASGTCGGATIPGCLNCVLDGDCADGNVCTSEICNAGVCEVTDISIPCDDGEVCTTGDACVAGTCTGTPVDCSSLDDGCNSGVCNPANGLCLATPANEGGGCDDGLSCTINDICTDGVCAGTLNEASTVNLAWLPSSQTVQTGQTVQIDLIALSGTCADQPVSSIEVILNWNPLFLQLVGKIESGPIPWFDSSFPDDSGLDGLNAPFDGTIDNDGDAYYQAWSGFPEGASIPPAGIVVTTFEFLALDGTTGTQIAIPPTAGSFTITRVLGAGATFGVDVTGTLGTSTIQVVECQTGPDCDDGNGCTTDTCNSGVCVLTNNTLSCDDGLFCTIGDVCAGGSCNGSADPCSLPLLCSESLDACVECLSDADCDDGNLCTTDTCDAFGVCQHPNNTLPCDDGLFCTLIDTCGTGSCTGAGSSCQGEVCDEANDRCVECLADGDCNDGNVCTDDVCSGNLCIAVPNVAACDDGLFCTSNDTCSDGSCVGGSDPCTLPQLCDESLDSCVACLIHSDCDDGNVCTTDVCSAAGVCANFNNSLPCDDGIYCNGTETCGGGACISSGDPCSPLLCDEAALGCVECFTVADCADDSIPCTVKQCIDGTCNQVPDDAVCADTEFCNGSEFCHVTLGCRPGSSPCDGPALCDEVADSCGCQEPVVAAVGSRYLAITPRSGDTPVALLVTGVDVDVACVTLYVRADGTLGTQPVYRPPTGPEGWETAYIRGNEILPGTNYSVRTQCDTGQGIGVSTPATGTTWLWADTDNSGGLTDFIDIGNVVDAFRNIYDSATLYSTDLWGADGSQCRPQLSVDFIDVSTAVDAFRQIPIPCPDPCG